MIRQSLLGIVAAALYGSLAFGQPCSTEAFVTSLDRIDAVQTVVLQCIDGARASIEMAVEEIAAEPLCEAVLRAHRRGVSVRVVFSGGRGAVGGEYERLVSAGLRVRSSEAAQAFGHRYVIVDRRIVLTGSYTWVNQADRRGVESLIRITCAGSSSDSPVRAYVDEFERLWVNSSESAPLAVPSPPAISALSIAAVDPTLQCVYLLNVSDEAVDVSGWTLSDLEGEYVFPTDVMVVPHDPYRVCADRFNPTGDVDGLYLDPDGDEVFLVTPEGVIVDERMW